MQKKLLGSIYSVALPGGILFLLLYYSPIIERPYLGDSKAFDFMARFWFSISLCIIYVLVSRVYARYDNKNVLNANDSGDIAPEKNQCKMAAIVLGILMVVLSWWVLNVFLPIFNSPVALLIAFGNGIIISLPLLNIPLWCKGR